jgi:c-di-GMP-binding flagellar brake protein YcgR
MANKSFGQRINIELGTNLLLSIDGIEGNLKSNLIGLVASEFIIIKAPIGYSGINDKLIEGNKITIKYIHHGGVFAFESFIISLISKPKTMIILSYPTTVNSASLRKSERHDCFIPCELEIEGKEISGTIMDISLKGCRCLVPELPEKLQRSVEKESIKSTLKFEQPNNKNKIELAVTIVNMSEYKSASKIGLAYEELDSDAENSLIGLTEFLEKQ